MIVINDIKDAIYDWVFGQDGTITPHWMFQNIPHVVTASTYLRLFSFTQFGDGEFSPKGTLGIYNLITQQPISCIFFKNYPNDIKESLLELIFHLTYCNHGFLNARTKVPLPLHSTKKAQEFFVSQEMQNGIVIESEKEFFT